MGFADSYRARMGKSGVSSGDSLYQHTKRIINEGFEDSPNFKVVNIEGVEYDTRILEGKTWEDKVLLLRPETKVTLGSHVEIDGTPWMIFDFLGETISPKVFVKHRNGYLRWRDADGTVHTVSALTSATRNTKYDISPDSFDISMLAGGIYVFAKATEESKTIRESQRFIIGNSVYEIAGVDDVSAIDSNGNGYFQFTCKLTTKRDTDDWTLRIADNVQINQNSEGVNGGGDNLW